MIFVDTSAWYAYFIYGDSNSIEAEFWFEANREKLITTDYVVDELLTLFRTRGKRRKALEAGQEIFDQVDATLYYLTDEDIASAWDVYRKYDDKDWSFTDCTCCAVMKRMGITTAVSFDHHFRQFDGITVVP